MITTGLKLTLIEKLKILFSREVEIEINIDDDCPDGMTRIYTRLK